MNTANISEMSAAELKALARQKEREEKANTPQRREYEKQRDTYIDTVFGKMDEVSNMLKAFKSESITLGLELHEKMYEVMGKKRRDGLDHYQLISKDGKRKVVIERQHRCEYDETAEVAIKSIKDVLREKFSGRNKGMYDMLESVLLKNNKGDYDERLVAKLRKHEGTVDDPRFSAALDDLARSYKPVTSQTYIRAYRLNDAGKWEDLAMNWSSM